MAITLDELKRVSIVKYAESIGLTPIKEGQQDIMMLLEHDSCKIYPTNTFYRFSTGHGGSVIDFAMEFQQLDMKQAIEQLKEYYRKNGETKEDFQEESYALKTRPRDLTAYKLPERAKNDKAIIRYLMHKRGIDYKIVSEYLKRKIIYQDTNSNVVFVGYLGNTPYAASMRSTYSSFKGEAANSFTEVGVYNAGCNHNKVVLTESVIDGMSYRQLYDFYGFQDYLSVNGVSKAVNVLNFHLVRRNPSVKRVIIAFDRDEAGEKAAEKVKAFLKDKYPEIQYERALPMNNDFNEDLVMLKKMDMPKNKCIDTETKQYFAENSKQNVMEMNI